MNWKLAAGAAGIIVLLLFLFDGIFVVRPDQFAIVTQFGDPVRHIYERPTCQDEGELTGLTRQDIEELARKPENQDREIRCRSYTDAQTRPGIYFKMPLTQDVRLLDARVRGWYDEAIDTATVELRTIDFTAFARWKIADPLKFYEAVRTDQRALSGMSSIVTARIQTVVRERTLASVVRSEGRQFSDRADLNLRDLIADYEECRPERNAAIQSVLAEAEEASKERVRRSDETEASRVEIVRSIRQRANELLQDQFGIHILDLHFTKLNYSVSIFDEMVNAIRADRERDIAAYEKIGDVCRGSIDQVKTRRKGEIDGARDREVRQILGHGQAEAIRIKAEAFGQDPDFFQFLKTLEVYDRALGAGTSLVLTTDAPLFELLTDSQLGGQMSRAERAEAARTPVRPVTPAQPLPGTTPADGTF